MGQSRELEKTKALMGALVRMKPKPHEEMKVNKKKKVSAGKSRGPSGKAGAAKDRA